MMSGSWSVSFASCSSSGGKQTKYYNQQEPNLMHQVIPYNIFMLTELTLAVTVLLITGVLASNLKNFLITIRLIRITENEI